MSQDGATFAGREEMPSTAQGPQGAGVQSACLGLREQAVRAETAAGFRHMCRVVDTPFSLISADILFELRAQARDAAAVAAFHEACAPGGPDTAALFDRAVGPQGNGSRYRDIGEVLAADRPLAQALHEAAEGVHLAMGGLYEGKLDCLRSTLCNPALGLDSSGCCAACGAVRNDRQFTQRLRMIGKTGGSVTHAKTNKRVLSIDQARGEIASRLQQGRAQGKVRVRLQAARGRLKAKFDAAMEGAASVIADLKAAAQTTVGELLDSARAKAAEVAGLEQSAAAARQKAEQSELAVEAAHAEESAAVAAAREQMVYQLADASSLEATRVLLMRREGERAVAAEQAACCAAVDACVARHRVELEQMEGRLEREFAAQLARVESQRGQELSSFPNYIQNLIRAEKLGHAADHQASIDIISGIATCLAKNATAGRRLNETEKQFYGILLNSQSPWAEKFVSHNLMGPSLRYIKRLRAERAPEIAMEVGEAAVRDVLVPLLVEHDVRDTPGGICEDGTTCCLRLDWERAEVPAEPEGGGGGGGGDAGHSEFAAAEHVSEATWRRGVKIWGLVGGPVMIHSLVELQELFASKTKQMARYVYTYTWVPTAKHAPWFPFIMLASDNKFTGEWCWRMWRRLHKACAAQQVALTWHGSDGDSRMRLCDYVMNLYQNRTLNGGWCDDRFVHSHIATDEVHVH